MTIHIHKLNGNQNKLFLNFIKVLVENSLIYGVIENEKEELFVKDYERYEEIKEILWTIVEI